MIPSVDIGMAAASMVGWGVVIALASGLGYRAFRLGHDRHGPLVAGWVW